MLRYAVLRRMEKSRSFRFPPIRVIMQSAGVPCCERAQILQLNRAMSTDPLLELLRRKARFTHQELADLLSLDKEAVAKRVASWEKDGTILGYHAVIDPESAGDTAVSAFIEVKVTPERGGGFDRLAMRIARFDQVVSCYLASGGYDLMVVVEGNDLRDVASFVSEKLSSLEGVLSTATHFRLKTYKENGFLFERDTSPERLAVAP